MAMESEGQGPEQDSDYDGAWKEALRRHLPECLAVYFPAMHAVIDWTTPFKWFDKELSQVLGTAGQRNKRVDMLVNVRLHSGQLQWILLHLEIQSAPEEGFERRIARFNSGLFWVFGERVATLVVLADLRATWRPQEDQLEVGGFESRLRFPICKLIDKLAGEWQANRSLPVQIARAQIEALRTAGDPEGRLRAKWQLVRNLYDAGYNADQVRELFRLIDWMMHLRADLEQRFRVELAKFEEQRQMPYVTSIERMARDEGRAEGKAEGKTEGKAEGKVEGKVEGGITLLLRQLRRVCGELPQDVERRIRALSYSDIETLGEALLGFRTLDDLRTWLDAN
jgi:hypothetical protein